MGALWLVLAGLFPPWWYEPGLTPDHGTYDVTFHPIWYRSPLGGEIIGFVYAGQLVIGLLVFVVCLAVAKSLRPEKPDKADEHSRTVGHSRRTTT